MDEFDLLARLNVAADHPANWYRIQQGVPCTQLPRIALNCVQLCTKSGVITSHYYKKIVDLATDKDLHDHTIMKNNCQMRF